MASTSILSLVTIFLSFTFLPIPTFSGRLYTEFLTPNFTASNFQFVDNTGAFLSSRNGTFQATINNPVANQQTTFYFSVVHVASNKIIWSANRNSPMSNSDKLTLTPLGITIFRDTTTAPSTIWSTPPFNATVKALTLSERGNLILLDHSNRSLWESFKLPTDTIVLGQQLPVGNSLFSSVSETNLSAGDYQMTLNDRDAALNWNGLPFWRLTMDGSAIINSNSPASYMVINSTGLYLMATTSVVVIQVMMTQSDFRIATVTPTGLFIVQTFSSGKWIQDFAAPSDDCKVPNFCGRVGLCTNAAGTRAATCSCPSGFRNTPDQLKSCSLVSNTQFLPSGCDSNQTKSRSISYAQLGSGIDYFVTDLTKASYSYNNSAACENICSGNCSCLGYFYSQSTGSCYLLKNRLGSFVVRSTNGNDPLGYVKILVSPKIDGTDRKQKKNFSVVALVLLPSIALFLLIMLFAIGYLWRRKQSVLRRKTIKLGRPNSNSEDDFDASSIPGLPVRFDYEELEVATDKFNTQIGAGGFGAVYKGTLSDKSMVAVKKINNLGNQGKKEFCTEIAIIGKIHHINLVKLRGFCAQGRQRLLVYEYMNRGSLDRTLFGGGPVLEWQERVDIALGTARGLAYLHSGCEQKIIHCDIKPENILLHDHSQVKISDFGLSKLLSPEQSSHFTTMRGTRGYLAPEWLTSSAISDKTDVYSYGMVVLEIVSGRKNCSMQTQSQSMDEGSGGGGSGSSSTSSISGPIYFPLFALEMHEKNRYFELADPKLEGRVRSEDVEKLVRVALCCVHEEPMLRPSMTNVVSMLEGGIPLGQPRVEALNFLRFYGRRFIEASVMEGSNIRNGFLFYPPANLSQTSTTSGGSHSTLSYLSSQQISGPR